MWEGAASPSKYSPTKSMLATNNNPPNQHNDVILNTLCDMHNPAKQTAEFLRGQGNVKPRNTYRDVEGIPKGASMLAIETVDRDWMADQVPNMTSRSVKVGRSYVSDGDLKTPTLHVNAKVQISYMNDEMKKGLGGHKKGFSEKEYTAQEAKRRMAIELKRKAKQERMGSRGRIRKGGVTVKSAAGRGKGECEE